ncbi:alpha/beta hydrolase [Pseudomaricurvus alkylphenolicus]|uniref:alpha/beta hydrolase n=1 Tax=Pseudomaricurvus alkylphenolicus TaxID=1306991 RepID=UPI00141D9890|nr:alpha/beta hydrolase [Pseudomaricurvus alkylphenolicus]NIB41670.1 alpha/beta hydrolase [Pseudomaricurvus alkylphenolicus]
MKQSEGKLVTQGLDETDSFNCHYRQWLPDNCPNALMLIVHGMGEHCARYQHVAKYFVERGFGVYALDHKGHGKSEGRPGHIDRFSNYSAGVNSLLQKIKAEYPELPRFLVGHSMGGLISADFLLQQQDEFVGCVLSGPAMKAVDEPPAWLLAINRLISRIFPTLGMMQLDANGVSRDPAVVQAYLDDPLVYKGKMSSRLVHELLSTMTSLMNQAAKIRLPVLVLHGESDTLTSVDGSRQFHQSISSTDKDLRIYPGLYHEIFNEPEQEQVLNDMATWLRQRLPQ